MEVERAMSGELQALKQELQQKGNHNRPQEEELISAMREQVTTYTKMLYKPNAAEANREAMIQVQSSPRADRDTLSTFVSVYIISVLLATGLSFSVINGGKVWLRIIVVHVLLRHVKEICSQLIMQWEKFWQWIMQPRHFRSTRSFPKRKT